MPVLFDYIPEKNEGISFCPFRHLGRRKCLLNRTNRFDTLRRYIYNAPKSVREGILLALGTLRLRMIYTSVGVTSAFVFD